MRHLELLNVLLALRFRQPHYPACLAGRGYLVQTIGVSFLLADKQKVAPDVIASNLEQGLTLLFEVKSGAQLDLDQLRRMRGVTPLDLRDRAHLLIREPDQHRVHVVYFCQEAHREAVEGQLGGNVASIIGFDGARFGISGAALPDADLRACLAAAIVEEGAPALAIVPFDRESPDEEVTLAIAPHIVDAWLQGSGSVRPESLVMRTHAVVHDAMASTGAGGELNDVIQRVKQVLKVLGRSALAPWLEQANSQPATWRFTKNPPTETTRTQELGRLRKALTNHIGAEGGVQLGLFDGGDAESEP